MNDGLGQKQKARWRGGGICGTIFKKKKFGKGRQYHRSPAQEEKDSKFQKRQKKEIEERLIRGWVRGVMGEMNRLKSLSEPRE